MILLCLFFKLIFITIIIYKYFFIRFIMFNKFCVPKESLLSKTGDINDDGQYISPFKDKSKRLGNIICIVCYTLQ